MTSTQEHHLEQKLNNLSISNELTLPQKNIYEVATTLGKLTIEVTRFFQYIIVIVTYSSVLKLDGYLQVAYPTPYSDKPSVLNLEKDEGQMDNERLSQVLAKDCGCPVLLSFNIEELNKGSEEELYNVLKNILMKKNEE